MKTTGQYEHDAIAASYRLKMAVFYRKRNGIYEIFRRLPGGGVTLLKRTKSAKTLATYIIKQELPATKNPAPRIDISRAADLAKRFHGRAVAPGEVRKFRKPIIPDAMSCIGEIYAIEYLAERDGKEYRFRHVFKVKSRPALAVSPDGTQASMIGGSWIFGEDGFEDI